MALSRYPLLATLITLTVGGAHVVRAQTVRGSVVFSGTNAPASGSLVRLVGADSTSSDGAFADDSGHFAIRARGPGRYRLRVERVGVRPLRSQPFDLTAGETRTERLVVEAVRTLAQVTIVGDERCTRQADGEQVALVWEAAHAALDATAFTQEQALLQLTVDDYVRDLSSTGVLRSEQRHRRTGVTGNPFVSAPPESLAAHGYVRPGRDSTTYYAPDARVLLSDAFASQHCWRMQAADNAHGGMVGLAFAPVASRNVPDVAGVLWIDRATSALRSLEFRYNKTNAGQGAPSLTSLVEFAQLRSGPWIVSRWVIRMPVVEHDTAHSRGPFVTSASQFRVREAGGVVVSQLALVAVAPRSADGAPTGTGGTSHASGGTVMGTAFDSTRGAPLVGAEVRLQGSDRRVVTDSAGGFSLVGVPAGTHELQLADSLTTLLGLEAPTTELAVRDGDTVRAVLAVGSTRTLLAALCGDSTGSAARAAVAGRVLDASSGEPLTGMAVEVSWNPAPSAALRVAGTQQTLSIETDQHGAYRICRLPPDVAIAVRVRDTDGIVADAEVVASGAKIMVRDLRVDLGPAPVASLALAVRGSNAAPIVGAQVSLASSAKPVTTSAGGTARVGGLRGGTHLVVVRSPGFAPLRQTVDLAAQGETSISLEMSRTVTRLEPVTVAGASDPTGFESRRRLGAGYFLTPQQIEEAKGATSLADVLASRVPGVAVHTEGNGARRLTVRGLSGRVTLVGADSVHMPYDSKVRGRPMPGQEEMANSAGGAPTAQDAPNEQNACNIAYFVDDARVWPINGEIDTEVPFDQVRAVEVYSNAATAPARFRATDAACGIILIWTKRTEAGRTKSTSSKTSS